jgi:pyruvate dehydrogenase complex dehydrogenase (E1) component
MANEINLIPFEKGISGNPKGRPKKYTTLLKGNGYKLSEINDTIQSMMAMNLDELKDVYAHKDSTILEKTIANAMYKSLSKGSLYSLDTLLTRVYGKPNEQLNLTSDNKIEVVYVKGKTIL